MITLGAVFLPQLPPERVRSVAQAAEDAGLEELWLWEDCFMESGIATAAAILAWTSKLHVGIGVLPAPLRNVGLAAMEMASLYRMFPDRVKIGLGHGVQDWMAQVGARVDSPMTLLREYIQALRALLDGELVSTQGRYVQLDAVKLAWPPSAPPTLYGAAVGPRSLRLCGEVADGTVLSGATTTEGVRQARALIDEGRQTAGRTDPHRITVYLMAATGADAAQRLHAEHLRWGQEPSADIGVAGDADTVAAAVQRWSAAGADSVILQPTVDEPDLEGFLHFITQEVRPLLS